MNHWKTFFNLGISEIDQRDLTTKLKESSKLRLKGELGILVPTFTDKELDFFTSKTNFFQDMAFLCRSLRDLEIDSSSYFPISHWRYIAVNIAEGRAGESKYRASLIKDNNRAVKMHGIFETKLEHPTISIPRIGLFQSNLNHDREIEARSDYQRRLDHEYESERNKLEESLKNMDIVEAYILELEDLGVKIKEKRKLNREGLMEKAGRNARLRNFSGIERDLLIVEDNIQVDIDKRLNFKITRQYSIGDLNDKLDSERLRNALKTFGKLISAGVYVAQNLCYDLHFQYRGREGLERQKSAERAIWKMIIGGVLKHASREDYDRFVMENPLGRINSYNTGEFFVATKDFEIYPLYGQYSINIFVPNDINMTDGERGHNEVYFLDNNGNKN